MTCRFLSLSSEAQWPDLLHLLEHRDNPEHTVETDVRAMLDAVRTDGDKAVLDYVRRFDCPGMEPPLRVADETIEQVHAAIVESQKSVTRQLDRLEAALEKIRVQVQEGNAEMGRMTQCVEADLAQTINGHNLQLNNILAENHRRICWLAIGNLILLLAIFAGIMAPYLK